VPDQSRDYPVTAALCGVGAWARVLANAARDSRKISFTCCLGRDPARAAAFSKQTGLPLRPDYASILTDPSIRAVVLALPNELHLEFARHAAAAGKHVYTEKPIATTLEDGLRFAELERTNGIRVAVGHCARLLFGNRRMRRAIDSGELGAVTQIETSFSNDRGLRLTRGDWRGSSASAPGGSLSQIAIHQLDTLRFLGGDIESISASAARHSPADAEVEDQWIICARFADGKLGTVVSNWTSPGTYSVRVTGQKALMFYEVDQTHWGAPQRLHEGAVLYRQERGVGPDQRANEAVERSDMFGDELDFFAESIVENRECELSAANGCLALAAVDAALESAANGGAHVRLADVMSRARERVEAAGKKS
jgi:predicted dehydrogenase